MHYALEKEKIEKEKNVIGGKQEERYLRSLINWVNRHKIILPVCRHNNEHGPIKIGAIGGLAIFVCKSCNHKELIEDGTVFIDAKIQKN